MGILELTDKAILSDNKLFIICKCSSPSLVSILRFESSSRLPTVDLTRVIAIIPVCASSRRWTPLFARVSKARWWIAAGFVARLRFRVWFRKREFTWHTRWTAFCTYPYSTPGALDPHQLHTDLVLESIWLNTIRPVAILPRDLGGFGNGEIIIDDDSD